MDSPTDHMHIYNYVHTHVQHLQALIQGIERGITFWGENCLKEIFQANDLTAKCIANSVMVTHTHGAAGSSDKASKNDASDPQ